MRLVPKHILVFFLVWFVFLVEQNVVAVSVESRQSHHGTDRYRLSLQSLKRSTYGEDDSTTLASMSSNFNNKGNKDNNPLINDHDHDNNNNNGNDMTVIESTRTSFHLQAAADFDVSTISNKDKLLISHLDVDNKSSGWSALSVALNDNDNIDVHVNTNKIKLKNADKVPIAMDFLSSIGFDLPSLLSDFGLTISTPLIFKKSPTKHTYTFAYLKDLQSSASSSSSTASSSSDNGAISGFVSGLSTSLIDFIMSLPLPSAGSPFNFASLSVQGWAVTFSDTKTTTTTKTTFVKRIVEACVLVDATLDLKPVFTVDDAAVVLCLKQAPTSGAHVRFYVDRVNAGLDLHFGSSSLNFHLDGSYTNSSAGWSVNAKFSTSHSSSSSSSSSSHSLLSSLSALGLQLPDNWPPPLGPLMSGPISALTHAVQIQEIAIQHTESTDQTTTSLVCAILSKEKAMIHGAMKVERVDFRLAHTKFGARASKSQPGIVPSSGVNLVLMDVVASVGAWTLPLSVPVSIDSAGGGHTPSFTFVFSVSPFLLKLPAYPRLRYYLPDPPASIVDAVAPNTDNINLPHTTLVTMLQSTGVHINTNEGAGLLLKWFGLDVLGIQLTSFQFSMPSSSSFALGISGLAGRVDGHAPSSSSSASIANLQLVFDLYATTSKIAGQPPVQLVVGFGMSWSYMLRLLDSGFPILFDAVHLPSALRFTFSSLFGWINVDGVSFLLSTADTFISNLPQDFTATLPSALILSLNNRLSRGFTVLGVVKVTPNNAFAKFLIKVSPGLESGIPFFFNMGLDSFQFAVVIGSIQLGPPIRLADNTISISTGFSPTSSQRIGVNIGLSTHLYFKAGSFAFDATGAISFNPVLETLSLQVVTGSPFHNAFGIPSLTINFISLGATLGTVTPWLLALNGGVSLSVSLSSSFTLRATTLFGIDLTTPKNDYFYGNVTPVTMRDFIRAADKSAEKYVPAFISDLGFPSGMHVSFSAVGNTVLLPGHDPVVIPAGLRMLGTVDLFGVEVETDIDIATGPIPTLKIKLDMLRELCLGKDHQVCLMDFNQTGHGPNLDLSFAPASFYAHASLRAKIFSREIAAYLRLDISGLSVTATYSLISGLNAEFQLQASTAAMAGAVKFTIDATQLHHLITAKLVALQSAANAKFKVASDTLESSLTQLSHLRSSCNSKCYFSCPQIGGANHNIFLEHDAVNEAALLMLNDPSFDASYDDVQVVEDVNPYDTYDPVLNKQIHDSMMLLDDQLSALHRKGDHADEIMSEFSFSDGDDTVFLSDRERIYSMNSTDYWPSSFSSLSSLSSSSSAAAMSLLVSDLQIGMNLDSRLGCCHWLKHIFHKAVDGVKSIAKKVAPALKKIEHQAINQLKHAGNVVVKGMIEVTNKVLKAGCAGAYATCVGACKASMEAAVLAVSGAQYTVNTVGAGFSALLKLIQDVLNLFRIDRASLEGDISKSGMGVQFCCSYTLLGSSHSFCMSASLSFTSVQSMVESLFNTIKSALLGKSKSLDPTQSATQMVAAQPETVPGEKSKFKPMLSVYASHQPINFRVTLSPAHVALLKSTGASTVNHAPKLVLKHVLTAQERAQRAMLSRFNLRGRKVHLEVEDENEVVYVNEEEDVSVLLEDEADRTSLVDASSMHASASSSSGVVIKLEIDRGGPHHHYIPIANRLQKEILHTGRFFAVIPGLNIGSRSLPVSLVLDHAHNDPRSTGVDVLHRLGSPCVFHVRDYTLSLLTPLLRSRGSNISLTVSDPSQSSTTIVQLIALDVTGDPTIVHVTDVASAGIVYLLHQRGVDVDVIPNTDAQGVMNDVHSATSFLHLVASYEHVAVSTTAQTIVFNGADVETMLSYASAAVHRNLVARVLTFNSKTLQFKVQQWARVYAKPECEFGDMSFVYGEEAHVVVSCLTDGSAGVHSLSLHVSSLAPIVHAFSAKPHADDDDDDNNATDVSAARGARDVADFKIVPDVHGRANLLFKLPSRNFPLHTRMQLTVTAEVTGPSSVTESDHVVTFTLARITRIVSILALHVQPVLSLNNVIRHIDPKTNIYELPVVVSNPYYSPHARLFLVPPSVSSCPTSLSSLPSPSSPISSVDVSDIAHAKKHVNIHVPRSAIFADARYKLMLCASSSSSSNLKLMIEETITILDNSVSVETTDVQVKHEKAKKSHEKKMEERTHYNKKYVRVSVIAPASDASWLVYIRQKSPLPPSLTHTPSHTQHSASPSLNASVPTSNTSIPIHPTATPSSHTQPSPHHGAPLHSSSPLVSHLTSSVTPPHTLLWSFLPAPGHVLSLLNHDSSPSSSSSSTTIAMMPTTGTAHAVRKVSNGEEHREQMTLLGKPRVIEFHTSQLPEQSLPSSLSSLSSTVNSKSRAHGHASKPHETLTEIVTFEVGLYDPTTKKDVVVPTSFQLFYSKTAHA